MAAGDVARNGVAVVVAMGGRIGSEVVVDVATVVGPEVRVAVGTDGGKTVAEGSRLVVGLLNGAHLSATVFLSFDSLTVKHIGHVTLRLAPGSSDPQFISASLCWHYNDLPSVRQQRKSKEVYSLREGCVKTRSSVNRRAESGQISRFPGENSPASEHKEVGFS